MEETKFDSLNGYAKVRALAALERENDEYERTREIREDVEKRGKRVLEIKQFSNYDIVKYVDRSLRGEKQELYQVYIDGKRCIEVTSDPKMILLIALAKEFDGANSQAATFMARMLKMNNEWTE